VVTATLLGLTLTLPAEPGWGARAKRAKPPQFPPSVKEAFFPNALEKLPGPRPERVALTPAAASQPAAAAPDEPADHAWSKLITPEVLENEIKSCQMRLAEAVQTPLKFKGGNYQQAREQLSLLAALFAIVAQHDQSVRWKAGAASIRDQLARAGFNCRVGTDQTYQEAKARQEELDSLVRGDEIAARGAVDEAAWSAVADREPLMQRLEQSVEELLSRWTANAADFSRHLDGASHEAQLVAALADIIARPGYDSADDAAYGRHAAAMQQAAMQVRDAAEQKNYEQARAGVGEIKKTCSQCHEAFRD
jgi:hypothetical protein